MLKIIYEHSFSFRNNVVWTDKTKVKMFGLFTEKIKNAHEDRHLIQTVKHGGGGMMTWTSFAFTG